MVNGSVKKLPSLSVGDTVILSIPWNDHGGLDFATITVIIVQIKRDVYQLGTRDGIINGWFPVTEMTKAGAQSMKIDDVPNDQFLSLREAAAHQSKTGGQGCKKCNCAESQKQCSTKRCACLKPRFYVIRSVIIVEFVLIREFD